MVRQDFNFHSKELSKGIINKKGTCSKYIHVHVFINYIINIKLFLKDDAGDYKPIECVAATLNNSVLYKSRISCNDTVKYAVCKQREYFYGYVLTVFANCRLCTVCGIFSDIVCNITNATKIKTKQRY